LWKVPHFQNWLISQKSAGNRLDGCNVELTFGVGPKKAFLLYWIAHVNIHVTSEGRNKDNEIVIGRPDIQHVVGYSKSTSGDILDTQVVLVREFRSPSVTSDGFIREVPGGSGYKPVSPEISASKEFFEETGIEISPERLISLDSRQLSGTTSSHKAHVFCVELEKFELELALKKHRDKETFGNSSETELTYVEVRSLRELIKIPLTDWSNLGMLLCAINI
jgi:8-oxo-dGTP pyrophosphatase MutT (NUDIX family)